MSANDPSDPPKEQRTMDLERRLRQHLSTTGEELIAPPSSPEEPIARATSRRRRRRAVGTSLAAVALLAGGLGAAQLVDRGSSQDIVAGGDANETVEGDDVESGQDESATASEAAAGEQAVAEEPAVAGAGAELPQSTGPVLEFVETSTIDNFYPSSIVWSGTAFVATAGDELGSRLVQTTDGTNWTDVAGVPNDVDLWGLQADGDGMLIAWGQDRIHESEYEPFMEPVPSRLFWSRNGGDSWDELSIPPGAPNPTGSDYLTVHRTIGAAAVNDDVVIVGVTEHTEVDIARLLADRGIESNAFYGYGTGDGHVMVCGDAECRTEDRYSYDELGLTDTEAAALDHGLGSTIVLRSVAGGPFEETGLSADNGFADAIIATNGEFIVCMMDGENGSQSLHASADGVTWEIRSSSNGNMGNLSSDGTALFAQTWSQDGNSLVRSDDGGRTWTPLGVSHPGIHSIQGGPGGLVATGQVFDEQYYEEALPEAGFPVTIEKDGVIVTWSEDSMTVVDATTGDSIYEFGPEQMDADDAPEGIVETDDGFDVLDPATGEVLVSILSEDFEAAFGLEEPVAVEEPIDFEEPEFFVGWSADGSSWGWQTSTDAFGVNGWAQLVVGEGRVLAVVEQFPSEPGEELEEFRPTMRMFVAELP